MSPDALLQGWAYVETVTDGDIGYAGQTPVARAAKGMLSTGGGFSSSIPRGVTIPHLREHGAVERVLSSLKPYYRTTLRACYVLPSEVTGRTQRQIADYLGLPIDTLNSRLRRVREALRDAG